jgi:hypothetical protein
MAGRDRSADAACRYQRGPTMFARIGVVNALNRGHVREFNTSRTDLRWEHRKTKRTSCDRLDLR